ncbi:hypothetical protein THTE_0985 [Thermogutta terrifontis]|uniref:Uncharacterized protein n=1 Tax=Thermogutta terrifontis TaxID=1331910 RepID=A0A286RCE8_9BACT|nr:hypothetical protein THTE_0985 [Thermogutta terrifontis]
MAPDCRFSTQGTHPASYATGRVRERVGQSGQAQVTTTPGDEEEPPSLWEGFKWFAKNFWGGAWIWKAIGGAPGVARQIGEDLGSLYGSAKSAELDRQILERRLRDLKSPEDYKRVFGDQWREAMDQTARLARIGVQANAAILGGAFIRPTQPVYEGTVVPRSFELHTSAGKVWVHPKATKHLAERAASGLRAGRSPDLVNLGTQIQMTSLAVAVEKALAQGIRYGEKVVVAGWELVFEAPRQAGQLPVLIHALPR